MIAKSTIAKTVGILAVPLAIIGLVSTFPAETKLQSANAASADMFLEIEGIPGEAGTTQSGIEIESWSWGASNPSSVGSGGMGSGKVSMQDFHFMRTSDNSSLHVLQAAAKGTHFPKATLRIVKPDGSATKITLSDLIVSSYGASSGNGSPTESFTLNFQKIEWTYENGKTFTWDLKKGTKI
ncbi:MAG: type VI secretion system tube protein Hcp [Candidatus Paceibacterota bacterium]|nr:type VI secretion system tube protein Hcp [Candidatus Paceibacterota bacterium]